MKTLDDVRDLSIRIVDKLVENEIVPNCTDTDDDTEFLVQDMITDLLCEKFNIEND
jgi:hypothetical protein